jgi:hypothetical protein
LVSTANSGLRVLQIEKAHIIGASLGGHVAFFDERPDEVNSEILAFLSNIK